MFSLNHLRASLAYAKTGWSAPAPWFVKMAVLDRHSMSDAPWLESGTYMGQTTRYLAGKASRVVTLEPAKKYYDEALTKFENLSNVILLNVDSSTGLKRAISCAESTRLNFWLDGHYSKGLIFKGHSDTPILDELAIITEMVENDLVTEAAIFIDDVRLFVKSHREVPSEKGRPGYPSLQEVIAALPQRNLKWWIEHDILVARISR